MLAALLLAAFAARVAQEPPKPACDTCKDRGVLACRMCAPKPCKSDKGYLFCSVEGGCADCGGARWRECNLCEHAPEIDVKAKPAELAKWRASVQPYEDYMGERDLVFLETAHFLIISALKKLDNKAASSAHDAAHLYGDRLEQLFADFQRDSGAAAEDFSNKTTVMVWTNEKDQEKASSKYTLEKTQTQAKLMGAKPVVSICFGKGRVRSDDDLYRAVVHQTAHCLLSNLYDGVWVGNIKHGWLDEGVAHLYENRLFGEVTNWCYLTDEQLKPLKLGRFEPSVAAAVADGRVPSFTTVASLDTVSLSPEQRMFAWSYCDYLVRKQVGKLAAVTKIAKKQKPASEAIQGGLGLSLTDFELDWKTWVGATYSKGKR